MSDSAIAFDFGAGLLRLEAPPQPVKSVMAYGVG